MKTIKLTYWICTAVIFLWEGLMPALTSHTELAVESIRSLGYPDYFRQMLTVFKVAGAIVLLLPFFQRRIKEWAYAGFGFVFISAFISHLATSGWTPNLVLPPILFAVLFFSYRAWYKLYPQTDEP